jgi:hypothetical protein
MKFPCTVRHLVNGRWLARSTGSRLGTVEVRAASRDEALEKLRGELRYRAELCPCSGVPDDYVELEVEQPPSPGRADHSGGAVGRKETG